MRLILFLFLALISQPLFAQADATNLVKVFSPQADGYSSKTRSWARRFWVRDFMDLLDRWELVDETDSFSFPGPHFTALVCAG